MVSTDTIRCDTPEEGEKQSGGWGPRSRYTVSGVPLPELDGMGRGRPTVLGGATVVTKTYAWAAWSTRRRDAVFMRPYFYLCFFSKRERGWLGERNPARTRDRERCLLDYNRVLLHPTRTHELSVVSVPATLHYERLLANALPISWKKEKKLIFFCSSYLANNMSALTNYLLCDNETYEASYSTLKAEEKKDFWNYGSHEELYIRWEDIQSSPFRH